MFNGGGNAHDGDNGIGGGPTNADARGNNGAGNTNSAGRGNGIDAGTNVAGGWGALMQSRGVRLALNGVCAALCAAYAVDAVAALVTPPASAAALVASIGAGAYRALTALRGLACAWAAVAFGRMTYRVATERGDDAGGAA